MLQKNLFLLLQLSDWRSPMCQIRANPPSASCVTTGVSQGSVLGPTPFPNMNDRADSDFTVFYSKSWKGWTWFQQVSVAFFKFFYGSKPVSKLGSSGLKKYRTLFPKTRVWKHALQHGGLVKNVMCLCKGLCCYQAVSCLYRNETDRKHSPKWACLSVCRNNLSSSSACISCQCGLYISTEVCFYHFLTFCSLCTMLKENNAWCRPQKHSITLEGLQHLLEVRVSEHMEECLYTPVFSVTADSEASSNLMISCQVRLLKISFCQISALTELLFAKGFFL